MVVVYADDEESARLKVSRALRTRGHTVFTLDTGSAPRLEEQALRLLQLVKDGLKMDVLVLDGHNYLHDENGQVLTDMTPMGLLHWLWGNGLAQNCHFILFSNDNHLVWQATRQSTVKFAAAICKVGEGGGLQALLDSVDQLL